MSRRAGFTIGALSAATGCNIETIRYYERVGLMPPPPRTAGGYRLYDESGSRRLRFIRRARELGFDLDEIRGLLKLSGGSGRSCLAVGRLGALHLASVRARLADLRQMERTLAELVAMCASGVVPKCPLIEALQRAE